ncbi:hypothetical protein PpBr36_02285, partial [Pyricularia pennisetigena]|uniref:hypothetical protein n=1 Tax=Pyricularia pennisetigena TaxID=1578925 RepID=UPI0011517986
IIRFRPSPKKPLPAWSIFNKNKLPKNGINNSEKNQRKPDNRIKAKKPKINYKIEKFDLIFLMRIIGFTTGSRETPSLLYKSHR